VSHYKHTDPYPSKTQRTEKSVLKEEIWDAQNRMPSVQRTLRAPHFLADIVRISHCYFEHVSDRYKEAKYI